MERHRSTAPRLAWLIAAAAAVSAAHGFMPAPAPPARTALLLRGPAAGGCDSAAARGRPRVPGAPCAPARLARHGHLVACTPGSGTGGSSTGDKTEEKQSRWERFVAGVAEKGPKFVMGDVSRAKLQEMGLSVLLSYGWVSNCNMAFCLIVSWVTFGKTTGLSPLAAGQWPGFLAVYMGLWLACNFLRPFRLAAAAAISPLFDKLLNFFQGKFRIEKPYAVLVTLFLVNIVGTLSLVFGGLTLATRLTGTPLLPAGVGLYQYVFKV